MSLGSLLCLRGWMKNWGGDCGWFWILAFPAKCPWTLVGEWENWDSRRQRVPLCLRPSYTVAVAFPCGICGTYPFCSRFDHKQPDWSWEGLWLYLKLQVLSSWWASQTMCSPRGWLWCLSAQGGGGDGQLKDHCVPWLSGWGQRWAHVCVCVHLREALTVWDDRFEYTTVDPCL